MPPDAIAVADAHCRLSIRAFEADPLLPTADGVREPQNRRVVIVIQ
ncbi:MAG: Outer membrane protein A precursor [Enhydrobacter sp.]|jgi:hypothetical protein|nr:MAG: Outer membrane protein A precursor [Enhydrobacter sp.]